MTYTEKRLEEYFKSLGYTLFEIKDSVFREEKSTFVFQTDNKNNTVDCSTILYDHAVKIYQALAEDRERVVGEIEKQFGDFLLKNWSGEEEVYSEIDRLKTDLLSSLDKPLTDKDI